MSSHIHTHVHTQTAVYNTACWAHLKTHTHTHSVNPSGCSFSLTPPGLHPSSPQPLPLPGGHLQGGAGQFELTPGVGVHSPSTARTPGWHLLPPHTHTHIPSFLVAITLLGTALSPWTAHILSPVQPLPMRALSFIGHQDFPAILSLPLSRVPCPSRSTRGPCDWGSQLSGRAEHKVRSHLGTAAASSSRKNRSAQSAGRGWGRGRSRSQGQGWVLPMARAP